MKNFNYFLPEKYGLPWYSKITDNIYRIKDIFVTSITFKQEPSYGENTDSTLIAQYPLEDILDIFDVYISDFYNEFNTNDSNVFYLEFASPSIDNIKSLNQIIGKHIYKKAVRINDISIEKLVIEEFKEEDL